MNDLHNNHNTMENPLPSKPSGLGKIVLKLLGLLLLGTVIGLLLLLLIFAAGKDMNRVLQTLRNGYLQYSVIIQTAAFLLLSGVGLVTYIQAARLLKEKTEEAEDRAEHAQEISLIAVQSSVVMQFLLFGLAIDRDNPMYMPSVILFLLFEAFDFFFQALIIKQVKLLDPSKRGEATDLHFAKTWMESCDEAQKMVIYQASYFAFTFMKNVLPIALCVTLLGKLFFGAGNFPIILTCVLWAAHDLSYFIYSNKLGRTKKLS